MIFSHTNIIGKGRVQKKCHGIFHGGGGGGIPPIRQNNYFFGNNRVGKKNLETLQNGLKHEKKQLRIFIPPRTK